MGDRTIREKFPGLISPEVKREREREKLSAFRSSFGWEAVFFAPNSFFRKKWGNSMAQEGSLPTSQVSPPSQSLAPEIRTGVKERNCVYLRRGRVAPKVGGGREVFSLFLFFSLQKVGLGKRRRSPQSSFQASSNKRRKRRKRRKRTTDKKPKGKVGDEEKGNEGFAHSCQKIK